MSGCELFHTALPRPKLNPPHSVVHLVGIHPDGSARFQYPRRELERGRAFPVREDPARQLLSGVTQVDNLNVLVGLGTIDRAVKEYARYLNIGLAGSVGVAVGVGDGVGVAVGVGDEAGGAVGVGVGDEAGVSVGVGVGDKAGVSVGVGVGDGAGIAMGEGVGAGVGVSVGAEYGVAVARGVGVGKGSAGRRSGGRWGRGRCGWRGGSRIRRSGRCRWCLVGGGSGVRDGDGLDGGLAVADGVGVGVLARRWPSPGARPPESLSLRTARGPVCAGREWVVELDFLPVGPPRRAAGTSTCSP